jgi:hypothetical protein
VDYSIEIYAKLAAVDQVVNFGIYRSARNEEWRRRTLDTEGLATWVIAPSNLYSVSGCYSVVSCNIYTSSFGFLCETSELFTRNF